MAVWVRPRWAKASLTALEKAETPPTFGDSPTPLAPVGGPFPAPAGLSRQRLPWKQAQRAGFCPARSRPLQPHILQRSRPRKGIDLHQRDLLDARPDPARPEIVEDRRKPGPLVQGFLDPVQHHLALRRVRFGELPLVH